MWTRGRMIHTNSQISVWDPIRIIFGSYYWTLICELTIKSISNSHRNLYMLVLLYWTNLSKVHTLIFIIFQNAFQMVLFAMMWGPCPLDCLVPRTLRGAFWHIKIDTILEWQNGKCGEITKWPLILSDIIDGYYYDVENVPILSQINFLWWKGLHDSDISISQRDTGDINCVIFPEDRSSFKPFYWQMIDEFYTWSVVWSDQKIIIFVLRYYQHQCTLTDNVTTCSVYVSGNKQLWRIINSFFRANHSDVLSLISLIDHLSYLPMKWISK